jgi:hypothetical protein
MKKQLLILFVAMFASASVALAQNLTGNATCIVPTTVTCLTSGALNPVPGTPYDYEVNVPTPPGTKSYNWFVTQDPNFITGSTLTAAIELNDGTGAHIQATGVGYNDPGASGTNTINITWKSFTHDPANPVFLVIYVQNADGCTTDNIQVYVIEPVHSFTLDIANIAIDGTAQPDDFEMCVAPVAGAVYNTASQTVEMDYGVNHMFFIVNAANFTNSWQPSFLIAGLAGSRTVTDVSWAYPADAVAGTWNVTTGAGANWTAAGAPVSFVSAQAGNTVGALGECIIVRVTVDNNQAETLVDTPISLAVDGIMLDPVAGGYATASFGDIHHSTCTQDGFDNDVITQVLTARPDIQAVDPVPFEPQNHD